MIRKNGKWTGDILLQRLPIHFPRFPAMEVTSLFNFTPSLQL